MLEALSVLYTFVVYGIINNTHNAIFLIGVIWIWITYINRQWRGSIYRRLADEGKISKEWHHHSERPALFVIPILNEPVDYFRKVLASLHASIEFAQLKNYHIVMVFDGVKQDWHKEKQREVLGALYELAKDFDHMTIATGDQEAKRPNVTWAQEYAVEHARRLYPNIFVNPQSNTTKALIDRLIYLPMDSDTILDESAVHDVMQPFSDDRIGGTTCLQQIGDPQGTIERIDAWMEDARAYEGAMCALNLPRRFGYVWTGLMFGTLIGLIIALSGFLTMSIVSGLTVWIVMIILLRKRQVSIGPQIICNPGRLSAWRLRPIWDRREEFLHDPCFFSGTERDPGDDRKHTNDMRDAGYDVTMITTTKLHTTAVNTWSKWWRQKMRWRRTGNGYTIQDSWSLSHYPSAFGTAWNDIFIMLWTTYVVFHWGYVLWAGESMTPIVYELLIAYSGMLLTMGIRQWGHLKRHPRDWKLLWLFPFFATALQIIGFFALLTPCRMGWGHRTTRTATGKRVPLNKMRYTVLKP